MMDAFGRMKCKLKPLHTKGCSEQAKDNYGRILLMKRIRNPSNHCGSRGFVWWSVLDSNYKPKNNYNMLAMFMQIFQKTIV